MLTSPKFILLLSVLTVVSLGLAIAALRAANDASLRAITAADALALSQKNLASYMRAQAEAIWDIDKRVNNTRTAAIPQDDAEQLRLRAEARAALERVIGGQHERSQAQQSLNRQAIEQPAPVK